MTDVLERVKTYQQFIGGEWVDSASGETLDVENPADGKVIATKRTPWPASPGRVFRVPSSVLDGVDPDRGAVTIGVVRN